MSETPRPKKPKAKRGSVRYLNPNPLPLRKVRARKAKQPFGIGDFVICPEIDKVPGRVIDVISSPRGVVVRWRDGIESYVGDVNLVAYDPDKYAS